MGLNRRTGEGGRIATQEHPQTALNEYPERGKIETLLGGLKTRGFDFEAPPMTDPKRLEKRRAFLTLAFCGSSIVGEWLHQTKPLLLKNHGRPPHRCFP